MNRFDQKHPERHHDVCVAIPPLERVNYFYGQLLGVREFRAEQDFFREKLKLHNRYLHGHGVVCGLLVRPCPPDRDPCAPSPPSPPSPVVAASADLLAKKASEAQDPKERAAYQAAVEALRRSAETAPHDPCDDKRPTLCVIVDCGLALDCRGNELVLRAPTRVDLLALLDAKQWARYVQGERKLWVSLCYDEVPVDPVRPMQTDACSGLPVDCAHARVRDGACIRVSLDPPHHARECSPCTEECCEPCELLAVVEGPAPGHACPEEAVDNGVRRDLGTPYDTTRIVGVSWQHGAHYTRDEAHDMLEAGLEIRFSRPVHAETLHDRAIFDIWGIEGGGGRSAQVFHVDGAYVDLPENGLVTSVKYKQTTGEYFQNGDRVIVTLRAEFVLDECCRAVDGENIGGRVPIILPDYEKWHRPRHHHACHKPPGGAGPWRSGNGVPGGSFESWFYIKGGRSEK